MNNNNVFHIGIDIRVDLYGTGVGIYFPGIVYYNVYHGSSRHLRLVTHTAGSSSVLFRYILCADRHNSRIHRRTFVVTYFIISIVLLITLVERGSSAVRSVAD